MHRRVFLRSEQLESRICLTATAAVDDGDLLVSGDADGDIEIVALGSGAYEVLDNGVAITAEGGIQGVTDDLRISLDGEAGDENNVSVSLGDEQVDRVFADLGDGDNSFVIDGGSASSLIYRGGDGVDDVQIDGTIDSFAFVLLGDGLNSLTVNGDVGRLFTRAGEGDDLVVLSETSTTGSASIGLGDGTNELSSDGAIEGRLSVSGGDGDDSVSLGEGAVVEGPVSLKLGDGTNTAEVAGFVGGSLSYRGGDGDDTLTVTESAEVVDNAYAKLGEGENAVDHQGTTGGDVTITSANAEDETRIVVDEEAVSGETLLTPGEQTEAGYYRFSAGGGRVFNNFRFGRR